MNDPRRVAVARVLTETFHGTSYTHLVHGATERVLAVIDELHAHDQRGNIDWDDETEPPEGES